MGAYRLRLTQRAGGWFCEALLTGGTAAHRHRDAAVTAPLFIALVNDNMGAHCPRGRCGNGSTDRRRPVVH